MYVVQRTNIYLEDRQLSVLRRLGEQEGRSVAELVRAAVDDFLRARGATLIEPDEWQARFDRLLARRSARPQPTDPTQVERDVAGAVREVREQAARGR